MAVDSSNNLYIADSGNNRIRMVNAATGIITTVAGDGSPNCNADTGVGCYGGDGGPATSAQLWDPSGVAVDSAGNLYIADTDNSVIRVVDAKTGIITTVQGSQFEYPSGIRFDGFGNLYIADVGFYTVWMLNTKSGEFTLVAGGGLSLGDGGPATSASLCEPMGVGSDSSGNLYIADTCHQRIRKV